MQEMVCKILKCVVAFCSTYVGINVCNGSSSVTCLQQEIMYTSLTCNKLHFLHYVYDQDTGVQFFSSQGLFLSG